MGTLGAVDEEVGVGDGGVEGEGRGSGNAGDIVVLSSIRIETRDVCMMAKIIQVVREISVF